MFYLIFKCCVANLCLFLVIHILINLKSRVASHKATYNIFQNPLEWISSDLYCCVSRIYSHRQWVYIITYIINIKVLYKVLLKLKTKSVTPWSLGPWYRLAKLVLKSVSEIFRPIALHFSLLSLSLYIYLWNICAESTFISKLYCTLNYWFLSVDHTVMQA